MMTRRILWLAGAIVAVGVVLIAVAHGVGAMSRAYTVTAYVYHITERQHYLILVDARRGIYQRRTLPVDVTRSITFSPDGRRALLHHGPSGNLRLAVYDIAGGVAYFNPPEYDSCAPSIPSLQWSPDSRYVAFACQPNAANPAANGLYLMDFDTATTQQIMAGEVVREVVWSPDSANLAIMTDHLQIIDANGYRHQSIPIRYDLPPPVWSPDGRRVAFADLNLNVYDLDNGETRILLRERVNYPGWSADGRYLAVVHSERKRVYSIHVDSGSYRLLDEIDDVKIDHARRVFWSPDDERLLIEQYDSITLSGALAVALPDRSMAARVSENGIIPSWSPDGRYIAFTEIGLKDTATHDRLRVIDATNGYMSLWGGDDGGEAFWSDDSAMMAYIYRDFSGGVAARQLYGWRPTAADAWRILPDFYSVVNFAFRASG